MTAAELLTVVIEGEVIELMSASAAQLETIKASKSRAPQLLAAKKYLKAVELLRELERDLDALQVVRSAPKMNSEPKRGAPLRASSALSGNDLAIVPFVATARPTPATLRAAGRTDDSTFLAPVPWDSKSFLNKLMHSKTVKIYIVVLKAAMFVCSYAPLFLLCLSMFYGMLSVVYVLAHPAFLVKAFFAVLDAVPNYTSYAMDSMWEEFRSKLATRFR